MSQHWKILLVIHPIHQIWCHYPRSRCLRHTYCIPGSSFLGTLQKHRRKLEGRKMYNPLVTGLFHQFPPLHSITRIIFIKLRSCGTLIKDLQSLLYHYLHFTIWLQSVLSASPFAPPFPNHSKIHIIPKIFHLLSCCYGLLSLEMLTNPTTLFGKLPFLTQKWPSSKKTSLPPPGSEFCLSLCSYNTLLIIPPLKHSFYW